MPTRENETAVRRWFTEVLRGGTAEDEFRSALERAISPRFVHHDGPDPERGYQAIAASVPGLLRAFPDQLTIE